MQTQRAKIDQVLPVEERILQFMQAGGNPYRLRVDGVSVRMEFADGAPSLQHSLAALGKR